jgi:WD40 repeat protein
MTPERYERLCQLFDQAQARPPDQRAAFLDEVGAADPALRAELESMLADDQQAQGERLLRGPLPVNAKALLPPAERPTLLNAPPAAEPDDALVGRRVGPYLIEERVGSGGMGTVYRALREGDYRQRVALKVIRPGLDGGELLRRFRTERQVLAELEHPHIARLLDGGSTDDGRPYFVMEYIDGQPLDRYCEARRLGTRERVGLLRAVCAAVGYAHGRGVLHRDLKPDNVLVTADGAPKVTDFGLAKRLEGGAEAGPTRTGVVLGTPSYMAPEQAAGQRGAVGPATDVYALGAILYELLTGRPPFLAETPLDTLLQVLEAEPVPPGRLHPKLAPDLETICLKCLRKDSAKRYAGVAALAEDLRRFQAGEPIQARPVGRAERLWRWGRRHPARAAAAGLTILAGLAVVALLVGSVFIFQLRKEQQRTQDALAKAEEYRRQLALERALALCEQGNADRGLLWLARTLELTPASDDDLQRTIRASLAGWRHQLHPLRNVLRHDNPVRAVAFSPDGQTLLTGCEDGTARLVETTTGKLLKRWQHAGRVNAVAFSPDAKAMAVASYEKAVILDAATGRERHTLAGHTNAVYALQFAPDGKTIVTGSVDWTARRWDVVTGQPIGKPLPHGGNVWAVAFSRDGRTILTGSLDGFARRWETATGRATGQPLPHDSVDAVAFSPDDRTILTGGEDGTARLWEAATGKLLHTLVHQASVEAVAFSSDGQAVLTASEDGTARLWEAATGRPIGAPLSHQGEVEAVAVRPDGKVLVTGSTDGTVRLWEAGSGMLPDTKTLTHQGPVSFVAFSPDGHTILTGSQDRTARLWEAATANPVGEPWRRAEPLSRYPYRGVRAAAFSPDGQTLMIASWAGSVQRLEVASGKPIGLPALPQGPVLGLGPNGSTVLLQGRDQTLRLWEAAAGQPIGQPLALDEPVKVVAFSPDGQVVLTVTTGIKVSARLWDVATGKPIGEPLFHPSWVWAVAFRPDGLNFVTACGDGIVRQWETSTGRLLGKPLPHQGPVRAVAFSPDGQALVTASEDWTGQLWEPSTGRRLGPSLQHQGPVRAVAFGPDGRTVLTGSTDGTARVWWAATGRPFGPPLVHQGAVEAVAYSRDGQTILTGSRDNTARLWRPPSPVEGEVERLVLWTQVLTGMELDAGGVTRVLDAAAWQERRRLDELGGPPP